MKGISQNSRLNFFESEINFSGTGAAAPKERSDMLVSVYLIVVVHLHCDVVLIVKFEVACVEAVQHEKQRQSGRKRGNLVVMTLVRAQVEMIGGVLCEWNLLGR